MIAGSYVRQSLATAIRVARFEPQAVAGFDNSFEGFYRSFFGVILCAPLYLLTVLAERRLALEADAETSAAASSLPPPSAALYGLEIVTYLVNWLAFPLVMIAIVRLIGATTRYVPFIVAYNWTSCIVIAATVVPYALYLAGALSLAGILAFYYPIAMMTLLYRWRVAKDALQIPGMTAVGVVILEALLSIFVALGAWRLRMTL